MEMGQAAVVAFFAKLVPASMQLILYKAMHTGFVADLSETTCRPLPAVVHA